MGARTSPAAAQVSDALATRGLLRFLTCGSVDDGKSTLIGRLLHETKSILEDQLSALEKDSQRHGTTGADLDLALLVDGLEAEREQGITIDVAYRFFSTPRRSFIVADTPGHEQYTRNMATGASNADLAILLVDARKGLLTQTRRHAVIASLLGVRHVVLAVNKIDLVGFDETIFNAIVSDFEAFAQPLGFVDVTAIPISARFGDNIAAPSAGTPWYAGPTLIGHLETVDVDADRSGAPFRMPVQWVNRPNLDFRGLSGIIASGVIGVGDEVVVASSGHSSRVARIVTFDGDLTEARAGNSVTIALADEIDAPRGEMLAAPKARPALATRFMARLVWMAEDALKPGRNFLLKCGARTVPATISRLANALDVDRYEEHPAETLPLNGIGLVEVQTAAQIAIDPYGQNRVTGAFILIDRFTNGTVAAGMITDVFGGPNVHLHGFDVDRAIRANQKNQRPLVLWFTGLPGSGKSTVANLVERRLVAAGRHTMLLDGDSLRLGLNADLSFDAASRAENIRRAGEVARLMMEAGLIVLCAFVSPFRADRDRLREAVGDGFVEIFVDTPVEICAERDPKGLYARAKAGGIANFTGVGQDYEAPEAAELVLRPGDGGPEHLAELVLRLVEPLIAGEGATSEDSAAL